MMALLVICTGCGKEVENSATVGLKCLDCRITRAVEPEKRELSRLFGKAQRYGDKGISLENLRKQSLRIYRRAQNRALMMTDNHERALQLLNQIFEPFFEKVSEPRIQVPQMGDLLRKVGKD